MKILELNDNEFPENLKKIKNPPNRIFVEGNIDNLKCSSISVIGSRNCSQYGEKWCEEFVKGLIEYDFVITSGMAIGIDSIAHNTALKYEGKTIAVLPSGFESIYPKENEELFRRIIRNGGTVISEYPPEVKASKEKFLKRNRIVSGLSNAILVIEAAYRSGTMVTAGFAKEQGKEVFCIPGSLDNSKSLGTNIMIQKGMKLVTRVKDITSALGIIEKKRILNINDKLILEDIDEEYIVVYKVLSKNQPLDFNEISKLTGLNISDVMSKITMLELEGKIKRVSGNRFVR